MLSKLKSQGFSVMLACPFPFHSEHEENRLFSAKWIKSGGRGGWEDKGPKIICIQEHMNNSEEMFRFTGLVRLLRFHRPIESRIGENHRDQ